MSEPAVLIPAQIDGKEKGDEKSEKEKLKAGIKTGHQSEKSEKSGNAVISNDSKGNFKSEIVTVKKSTFSESKDDAECSPSKESSFKDTSSPSHLLSSPSFRTRLLGKNILSAFFSSPLRARNRALSPNNFFSGKSNQSDVIIENKINTDSYDSNNNNNINNSNNNNNNNDNGNRHYNNNNNGSNSSSSSSSSNDDNKLHGNEISLSGEVQLHHTETAAEALTALGGFRILYPLLVTDRTRQVASVRVIASLISKKHMYSLYLQGESDRVILFCCHVTPGVTSVETLQVLFDLATSLCHTLPHSPPLMQRNTANKSTISPNMLPVSTDIPSLRVKDDAVHQDLLSCPSVLSLIYDVSLASVHNTQLARVAVDWLRGVCDDVCENNRVVMRILGVIPFLLLLSLWRVTGVPCVTEKRENDMNDNHNENDNDYNKGSSSFSSSTSASLLSISPLEGHRLQQSCLRFLKQLLIGTSGDQTFLASGTNTMGSTTVKPLLPNSASFEKKSPKGGILNSADVLGLLVTPTGFTSEAMKSLFGFIRSMHK